MTEKLEKQTKKLANGLQISVVPMPGFNQVYGLAMANFGSVDTQTQKGALPAGIAHFIEHKLFAKPNYDVSEKFAQYGANSNAYTSYTKTAYLFQTLENPYDNLRILLDLVQNPYFTDANVASERGIIDQEIQMYLDMPEWVLEQRILGKLYPNDPIAQDIAGSSASLKQINRTNLSETYLQNYRPDNMDLVLVGDVDFEKIENIVESSDFHTVDAPLKKIQGKFAPIAQGGQETMDISQARSSFGIRIDTEMSGYDLVKKQFELNMIMETLIGESSKNYQEMSRLNLIDDSFSYNVVAENNYCFIIVSGSTNNPEQFQEYLRNHLSYEVLKEVLSDAKFERIKRDAIGSYLFAQNSPDAIANQMAELYFYDVDYLQLIHMIDSISKDDVLEISAKFLKDDNCTYYNLLPNRK
ncbi:EF-P 5-aminopentanol modification-associated protein YfmH [Companilactobacillus halodurans]|uniref:Insulinase family protein n=1 Tax=Companilactobacillus halodurans TaxID=2584183 RepID=A0A5P0ZNV0_9LACO|nr:pitrilysin family protein [Companilactobacillus halodurans]MQS75855.1 insulinase family protein [Companilactobacillus halodurans]MQS96653.1 insulinase family protein [Companilactobacillus halodurans]